MLRRAFLTALGAIGLAPFLPKPTRWHRGGFSFNLPPGIFWAGRADEVVIPIHNNLDAAKTITFGSSERVAGSTMTGNWPGAQFTITVHDSHEFQDALRRHVVPALKQLL